MSGAIGGLAIGQTPVGGDFAQSYTATDVIRQALIGARVITLAQTLYAEDLMLGYQTLNGMLSIWSRKRWLIWHLLDVSVQTTYAQQSYSVGPGGNFDVPRPDRLEGAYFRQEINGPPNYVDYWLEILQSMEDYGKISLKNLTSWPVAIFYDAAFPLGYVYPVPIPNQTQGVYFLHLLIKDTLNQFPTLATPVNLPPEYFEAIWTNLAVRLGALYQGAEITPALLGLAKASLSTIRGANAQIPRLLMPTGMTRPPLFNIYSYQTY